MKSTERLLNPEYGLISASFKLLLAAGIMVIFSTGLVRAEQPTTPTSKADVTVYKTASCGCCGKWANHLEQNGLKVEVIVVNDTSTIRARHGVPRNLASCHTAVVGDYWVEGHVPADLISRLMQEQPEDIKGLSAPGMPPGSPGMDIPNSPEYKVYSVNNAGDIQLYATPQGHSSP